MLKTTLPILLVAAVLAVPPVAAASTLYRCTDEFGHTTYTNYKAGNRKCSVLSRDDTPSAAGSSRSGNSTPAKSSPSDFPKVAGVTQKNRDGDRRYILEQELSVEQKHLEEARQSLATQLATQPAPGTERLQPTRDRIALHERNLDALRREISNLKQ